MAADGPASNASSTGLRRELGLWDLVLLNVVAIVGLRWWLTSAGGYGYAALPLWVLAFFCFFVPSAFSFGLVAGFSSGSPISAIF